MELELKQLLDKLNPDQREAVEAPPGPLLILAGAGSGKTRVLIHRIAYLIQVRNIAPWNILAVTFTNKAAEEMQQRVRCLIPQLSESVNVSTFHSLAAQILRHHIGRLGYSTSFVIYDTVDQQTLLKRVLNELSLARQEFDPRTFRNLIDQAKNRLEWPEEVVASPHGAGVKLPEVYARYQLRLKKSNAVDFGDLLLLCVKLLREFPEIRQEYLDRYQHLLIDEYQDTNHAQFQLAKLLTHPKRNSICVVGDEDQSIYAFRGADISNIINFSKQFGNARVIKLEQNYRSTEVILNAADSVVSKNEARLGKTLWTDRGRGELIHYLETGNDVSEANRVAEEILRLRATHDVRFGDVAIFYRANSQSRSYEEAFNTRKIPYVLVGIGFYERKEIKDIRAYLQLLYNSKDDASFDRILNEPPRGIGNKARSYLYTTASEHGRNYYEQLCLIADSPDEHKPYGSKLASYAKLLEKFRTEAKHLKLRELIEHIMDETGYRDRLVQAGDVESESRLENLKELLNVAADYDSALGEAGLQLFLETISLRTQADDLDDNEGRVTLMTLHNAKGLEFPVVFVVGMEDGMFPHSRTLENALELEEERRLCYVGLTRAMNRLYLVRARQRRTQGESRHTYPSRFLKDIPSELVAGKRGLGVGQLLQRYARTDKIEENVMEAGTARPKLPPRPNLRSPRAAVSPRPTSVRTWLGPKSRPSLTKKDATSLNLGGGGEGREPHSSALSDDDGPFRDLRVGRCVAHPTFGEGRIKKREGPHDNPRLIIEFKDFGRKRLMARQANLELIF